MKSLLTKRKYLICPSDFKNPIVDYSLSPDGNWLSVLFQDGTLHLYETRKQMKMRKLKFEMQGSLLGGEADFSKDNKSLYLTLVKDKGLVKINIDDLTYTPVLPKDQFGNVSLSPTKIKFLKEDTLFFINMNEISIYNLADKKFESQNIKPSKLIGISRIEFDMNYLYVLGSVSNAESGIAIFDLRTLRKWLFYPGIKDMRMVCAFCPIINC